MFYKETEFKETLLGKIPKDWNIKRLIDCANYINGYGFGPKDWKDKGLPIIRIKNLHDHNEPFNYFDGKIDKRYVVNNGDILLSWSASIDVFLWNRGKAVLNQHIFKVVPKEEINKSYLYYVLFLAIKQLKSRIHGSTMKHFRRIELTRNRVPAPPIIQEQQRIAKIFCTVDEAIQKTNEIIAETERLKKSLMQELLTKGIGHKEFKDTEIGRIPKDWEIMKLKDVILEAKSGFACGERDENGILQLRMDSIETEGWINIEAGVKVPIPKNVEEYLLRPGDVIFNNTNSVDLIGKTAIFNGEFPECVYSNHLTRIRVNFDKVIPEWLSFILIRNWQLCVFRALCHRHVGQAGINKEDLLNLKIPIPRLPEQRKIASILSTVDKKLKLERNEKTRLEKIKQGLMDLLLTGKIRVKVS